MEKYKGFLIEDVSNTYEERDHWGERSGTYTTVHRTRIICVDTGKGLYFEDSIEAKNWIDNRSKLMSRNRVIRSKLRKLDDKILKKKAEISEIENQIS